MGKLALADRPHVRDVQLSDSADALPSIPCIDWTRGEARIPSPVRAIRTGEPLEPGNELPGVADVTANNAAE